MKRLFMLFIISILAIVLFADNRTMVILKKDGNMIAMLNSDIDSITFSQFELPEKYYKMGVDTVLIHDTILSYVEVHDTIYIDKPDPSSGVLAEVDLGLPSGTLWANMNLNAKAPEEAGGYYAWGEANQKYNFTSDSYSRPSSFVDAATEQLGPEWSVPTSAQMKELRDYCNWQEETINGKDGCRITGSNGNSIFLPYTGVMTGRSIEYKKYGIILSNIKKSTTKMGDCGYTLVYRGTSANYDYVHDLSDDKGSISSWYTAVYEGYQIRPVKNK